MSYDDRKKDYSKDHIYVVDLLLDYCSVNYGESPCQASLGDTGQRKCYNTRATCQDPQNYAPEPKRYRHCTPASNLPANLYAQPDIKNVQLSPTEIDIGGGLGRRASISITFADHPGSDINIDKYLEERISGAADADGVGIDPLDSGTYWGKLRARNPFYNSRFVEVYSGYIQGGTFDLDNFQRRTYVIERIEGPSKGGSVRLTAKDPLKLTNIDRAQAPLPSIGQLAGSLSDNATSFDILEGAEDDYPSSGKVRIGDEVMDFTRDGVTFTLVRGQDGTEAVEHDSLDSVQLCLVYLAQSVSDVLFDLLTTYADVPASFIDKAAWDEESAANFEFPVNTVITEPVGVEDLLVELAESAPHQIWWDERTDLINFEAIKSPTGSEVLITDNDNFISDSVEITDAPDKRISQVWFWFGQADRTESLDEKRNFRQYWVRANLEREGQDQYRGRRIKTVFSRWINAANRDFAANSAALLGRRFGRTPRIAEFSLSAKDNDIWAGDKVSIRHRTLQDETGRLRDLVFQVISVTERDVYRYRAMQVLFDPELPEDDQPLVFNLQAVSGVNDINLNLRDLYEETIGTPEEGQPVQVNFLIPENVVVGSSSVSRFALDTGLWPDNYSIFIDNRSRAQGRGGNGGNGGGVSGSSASSGSAGSAGGPAIRVQHPVEIDNSVGEIWSGGGGGGGGGAAVASGVIGATLISRIRATGGGGGGAQGKASSSGGSTSSGDTRAADGSPTGSSGSGGSESSPGSGGSGGSGSSSVASASAGNGGSGGQAGQSGSSGQPGSASGENTSTGSGGSGGSPGIAIQGISLVTFVGDQGDIRGATV